MYVLIQDFASSTYITNYFIAFLPFLPSQIVSAISYHFGESLVRARFTEYVLRFVRLVARYEEDYLGSTKSGFPTSSFMISVDGHAHLGSGLIFTDEMSAAKELAINANRIEGWRRTKMYEYYCQVSSKSLDCIHSNGDGGTRYIEFDV